MEPSKHYCGKYPHKSHDWFLPFEDDLYRRGFAKCYRCGFTRRLR